MVSPRKFFILAFIALSFNQANSYKSRDGRGLNLKHWADAALNVIHNLTCSDTLLTTEEDCLSLISIAKSEMTLYFAEPSREGQLITVMPDGKLDRRSSHDAVMVLDPYPRANLGHLLVLFFVDINWNEERCIFNDGHYLGNNECLSLGLRKSCHNQISSNLWKRQSMRAHIKRCEINFFPLVYIAGHQPTPPGQRLGCRNDVHGFKSCPTQRPRNETDTVMCHPLQMTNRGCSAILPNINSRCERHVRCDHAVLISGGWDRLADHPTYLDNLVSMHGMLRRVGFLDENIVMFYSNGYDKLDAQTYRFFPSAFKGALRNHIRNLCRNHCADSLVIYLNSPTHPDGSSLLWDIDGDGEADAHEVYTIKELLLDTRHCNAHQVYMVSDQSYAGKLVMKLKTSNRHSNVLAFASGEDDEYAWQSEYTHRWLDFGHYDSCVGDLCKHINGLMLSSHPVHYDASHGSINKTLRGGSCDRRSGYADPFKC